MSFPPPALKQIATEVAELLIRRRETVAIAETAAGGLMSSALIAVPGTSSCFGGGVVAYSLPSRKSFLGWTDGDTVGYDGPTEAIVTKLATNVRDALAVTYGIAESGVAGPSRPDRYRSEIRGPGYCALAVVSSGNITTKTIDVSSQALDRGGNMLAFAEAGLSALLDVLRKAEDASKL
ncbi:hypothetical protein P7C70_g5419, partial [Phenoliferia sp. Uapishka_3]